MTRNRFRVAVGTTALGVVVALSFAAGCVAGSGAARLDPPPADAPAPAGAGTIVVARGYDLLTFDPDGKRPPGAIELDSGLPERPVLSPDGTRVAVVVCQRDPIRDTPDSIPIPNFQYHVEVHAVAGGAASKACDLTGRWAEARWLPDGSALVVGRVHKTAEEAEYVVYNPAANTTRRLALPKVNRLTDAARDGRFLAWYEDRPGREALGWVRAGEDRTRPLTTLASTETGVARVSPDGTKVLFADADPARPVVPGSRPVARPFVLDVATGRRAALADFPERGRVVGLAWSPDGRRVAYTWRRLRPDGLADVPAGERTETSLVVADADGRNATTLATEAPEHWLSGEDREFGELDWR